MARPIETADDDLLDAADRVLMTVGPSAFTLARAAEAAGVSAATLVKRFGSKEQLFVRLSERWAASLDAELTRCARARRSALGRLRAVALHNYRDLDHVPTAHNQIAALAVDLQNAKQRELLHRGWTTVRGHLARHAADALDRRELIGAPPPAQLARIVFGTMEGGCIAWSVKPEGSLIKRLSEDLSALLAPWTVIEPA